MRILACLLFVILNGLLRPVAFSQVQADFCNLAFNSVNHEFAVENPIYICQNSNAVPYRFVGEIDMPVCDDTLCANVILKIYWDLAGNYTGFDTIPGKPLTKFDHKKFTTDDYIKLDRILKNRNSVLRRLRKEELVDKSVKVKAQTVDAVTGATPKTISEAVVEGAVYSSFTLWHFVNLAVKDSMMNFTQNIYSEQVARLLLLSENYETQLFALRKLTPNDYEFNSELLFHVIRNSVPLVRAFAISKVPLPFVNTENNVKFAALFAKLDNYSRSIFLGRITSEERSAKSILPLLLAQYKGFDEKQLGQIKEACLKYKIQVAGEILGN
jgi:hypothetical protein